MGDGNNIDLITKTATEDTEDEETKALKLFGLKKEKNNEKKRSVEDSRRIDR